MSPLTCIRICAFLSACVIRERLVASTDLIVLQIFFSSCFCRVFIRREHFSQISGIPGGQAMAMYRILWYRSPDCDGKRNIQEMMRSCHWFGGRRGISLMV
jgi:hypothetical protein